LANEIIFAQRLSRSVRVVRIHCEIQWSVKFHTDPQAQRVLTKKAEKVIVHLQSLSPRIRLLSDNLTPKLIREIILLSDNLEGRGGEIGHRMPSP
jgi:hypothetical protein